MPHATMQERAAGAWQLASLMRARSPCTVVRVCLALHACSAAQPVHKRACSCPPCLLSRADGARQCALLAPQARSAAQLMQQCVDLLAVLVHHLCKSHLHGASEGTVLRAQRVRHHNDVCYVLLRRVVMPATTYTHTHRDSSNNALKLPASAHRRSARFQQKVATAQHGAFVLGCVPLHSPSRAMQAMVPRTVRQAVTPALC